MTEAVYKADDVGTVTCAVCGHTAVGRLSPNHVRIHGEMSMAEYRATYPEAVTITEAFRMRWSASLKAKKNEPEQRAASERAMRRRWAEATPEEAQKMRDAVVPHRSYWKGRKQPPAMLANRRRAMQEPEYRDLRSRLATERQVRGGRVSKHESDVAAWLDGVGVKYERQAQIPGIRKCFDFVLRDMKAVIEVDGCFWHGCPEHFPPGKPLRNGKVVSREHIYQRDRAMDTKVEEAGWLIVRVWEHAFDVPSRSRQLHYDGPSAREIVLCGVGME